MSKVVKSCRKYHLQKNGKFFVSKVIIFIISVKFIQKINWKITKILLAKLFFLFDKSYDNFWSLWLFMKNVHFSHIYFSPNKKFYKNWQKLYKFLWSKFLKNWRKFHLNRVEQNLCKKNTFSCVKSVSKKVCRKKCVERSVSKKVCRTKCVERSV